MKKLAVILSVFVFFALISTLPCSANSVNTINNGLSVVASFDGMVVNLASDLVAGYYKRVWVPGHWQWRHGHRYWVPGYYRQVWVPGGRHWVPGHWVWRHGRRHWVPGHWVYR